MEINSHLKIWHWSVNRKEQLPVHGISADGVRASTVPSAVPIRWGCICRGATASVGQSGRKECTQIVYFCPIRGRVGQVQGCSGGWSEDPWRRNSIENSRKKLQYVFNRMSLIDRSIDQSKNQTINQSIDQSIKQSINRPLHRCSNPVP